MDTCKIEFSDLSSYSAFLKYMTQTYDLLEFSYSTSGCNSDGAEGKFVIEVNTRDVHSFIDNQIAIAGEIGITVQHA